MKLRKGNLLKCYSFCLITNTKNKIAWPRDVLPGRILCVNKDNLSENNSKLKLAMFKFSAVVFRNLFQKWSYVLMSNIQRCYVNSKWNLDFGHGMAGKRLRIIIECCRDTFVEKSHASKQWTGNRSCHHHLWRNTRHSFWLQTWNKEPRYQFKSPLQLTHKICSGKRPHLRYLETWVEHYSWTANNLGTRSKDPKTCSNEQGFTIRIGC